MTKTTNAPNAGDAAGMVDPIDALKLDLSEAGDTVTVTFEIYGPDGEGEEVKHVLHISQFTDALSAAALERENAALKEALQKIATMSHYGAAKGYEECGHCNECDSKSDIARAALTGDQKNFVDRVE
jgi:hypothetical protein